MTKFLVCCKGELLHLCLPVSSPRETAVLPSHSKAAAAQPWAALGTCCVHAAVWWAMPSQHNQEQGLPMLQLHQQHRSCSYSKQWHKIMGLAILGSSHPALCFKTKSLLKCLVRAEPEYSVSCRTDSHIFISIMPTQSFCRKPLSLEFCLFFKTELNE